MTATTDFWRWAASSSVLLAIAFAACTSSTSDDITDEDRVCRVDTDCALKSDCYCVQEAVSLAKRKELDSLGRACPAQSSNAGPCPTFIPICGPQGLCRICNDTDCPSGDAGPARDATADATRD